MDDLSAPGPAGPSVREAGHTDETIAGRGRALVFIGFMGAGKSTAARDAAVALGRRALDSDRLLEQRFGHSIAEEFAQAGEAAFRASEEQLVLEVLGAAGADTVVALGGGSVLSERVQAALREHVTVLLDIDVRTAWARATRSPVVATARPRPGHVRAPVARAHAAVRAPRGRDRPGDRPATRCATRCPMSSPWRRAGARRGCCGPPRARATIRCSWPAGCSRARCGRCRGRTSRGYLVTDETVGALHGGQLPWVAGTVAIEPGERHKSLVSAERVWTALAGARLTRADHVVGLGGGVVGDLAGFCAATYQRGVPVVHVPTTLVAQVDSAYGGKTGVDIPGGKNYVGVYHQPAGVMVDPATLDTLPRARAGRRLRRGAQDGADRRRRAVGARGPRRAARRAHDRRVRAHEARRRGRRRARRGGAPDAQPRAHHRPRDRGGHRLRATAPRRGGGPRSARRAAAVRTGRAARAGAASCCARTACPRASPASMPPAVLAATTADKKRTGEHVPFVLVRCSGRCAPRRDGPGGRPAGRDRGGDRVVSAQPHRVEVMHGVNLDMLGRRDPRQYGTLTLAELQETVAQAAASSVSSRASSRPTPRASSSSTCTAWPSARTRSSSTPARGRTTPGRSTTRWRSRACRRWRSTCPTCGRASLAPRLGHRGPVRGHRRRARRGRLPRRARPPARRARRCELGCATDVDPGLERVVERSDRLATAVAERDARRAARQCARSTCAT